MKIQPLKGIKKTHTKQPAAEHLPKLPARWLFCGRSGSGKTLTLQNMILNKSLYRGCWDYTILMGPTIKIDDQWRPVMDYMKEHLGQGLDDKSKPCIIEKFDNDTLVKICDAHEALVKKVKDKKSEHSIRLPAALIVAEDLADNPDAVRRSHLLSCYCRCRHINLTVACLS